MAVTELTICQQFNMPKKTLTAILKQMLEKGYIEPYMKNEAIQLTPYGIRESNEYLYRHHSISQFLQFIGVHNVIEKVISKRAVISDHTRMTKASPAITNIRDIIDQGEHQVCISLFKINPMERAQKSMADRGFERIAKIIQNSQESYLELTVKEMHATSRVDGHDMKGHLASLKYLSNGRLKNAEIQDGKVRIPLDVCTYEVYDHGIIWGNVSITVACSIGNTHMPESTARLMFIV